MQPTDRYWLAWREARVTSADCRGWPRRHVTATLSPGLCDSIPVASASAARLTAGVDRTVEGRHDALGDRHAALQVEGVADGDHADADLEVRRVAELGGGQVADAVDLHQRQVGVAVDADQ